MLQSIFFFFLSTRLSVSYFNLFDFSDDWTYMIIFLLYLLELTLVVFSESIMLAIFDSMDQLVVYYHNKIVFKASLEGSIAEPKQSIIWRSVERDHINFRSSAMVYLIAILPVLGLWKVFIAEKFTKMI